MNRAASIVLAASFLTLSAQGDVKVVVNHNNNSQAEKDFTFKDVPEPTTEDAAAKMRFSIADGQQDGNGAGPRCLTDGLLPDDPDQPSANFFFVPGSDGGMLALDLGSVREVKQVNTYSWHPSTRGPQVYTLYASDGTAKDFEAKPKRGGKLEDRGWKRIAEVNTSPRKGDGAAAAAGEAGGQYGVSVRDTGGTLGNYRYLLFDIRSSGTHDRFGNTFYSEIDVIASPAAAGAAGGAAKIDPSKPIVARTRSGKYEFSVDVSEAPELAQWANDKLNPVLLKWYPLIVEMLSSDDFEAPAKFTIVFKNPGKGVAATSGTNITCAAEWFKKNLESEAIGAVVHELVHVAQQYGAARKGNPNASRAPGWLTEGIADYIRWFRYEPESKGAHRMPADAKYDGSYRVSANFLNYVTERYDKRLVPKLNAALREGKPTDPIWKDSTGKTVEELGEEWKEQPSN